MNKKSQFPTREELDHAFHILQDQIIRISVKEEEEMEMIENKGQEG